MKRLLLHPLAAPSDRLRVWVGAFRMDAPPTLSWQIDGNPVVPVARRALRKAWSGADTGLKARTGVYEFTGLTPDHEYRVRVSDGVSGSTDRVKVRTLPTDLPALGQGWFNVLLTSCFHASTDKQGRAGKLVRDIPEPYRPDVTLLMGDQVYLDLPTLKNFRDDEDWLADTFERNYANTWRSRAAYSRLLDAAPSVSSPDDHEYWNNCPHPATVIQNTWTEDGRERWRQAAREMYEAFQYPFDPAQRELGRAITLDVGDLSIFVADNRSDRQEDRARSMHPKALQELKDWATQLVARRRYGVIVTGQSLFQGRTNAVQGSIGDRHLADYRDYAAIVKVVDDLAKAGRPVVCITGDVHFGRVLKARDPGGRRASVYEVISSPTSLVEVVAVDQFKRGWNRVRGLFGKGRDFPLHGDPDPVPGTFPPHRDDPPFHCEKLMGVRGNQFSVLSFCKIGSGGLRLDVRTWRIHEDARPEPPIVLEDLKLRPIT